MSNGTKPVDNRTDEDLDDTIEGDTRSAKHARLLETIRERLEALYGDDPNLHKIMLATFSELTQRSEAFLESLVGAPVPGRVGPPQPSMLQTLQAFADAAWGRKTAPGPKERAFAEAEGLRGQQDDGYVNEYRKLLGARFVNTTGDAAQAVADELDAVDGWRDLWTQAVEKVEDDRGKKRDKEFDALFKAQVQDPIEAFGVGLLSGKKYIDAILDNVKKAQVGFKADYERWYAGEVTDAAGGIDLAKRAKADAVGPVGFMMAEWPRIAQAISPGSRTGGAVATAAQFRDAIKDTVSLGHEVAEERARKVEVFSDKLDVVLNGIKRMSQELGGLDKEGRAQFQDIYDSLVPRKDDLIRDYTTASLLTDPMTFLNTAVLGAVRDSAGMAGLSKPPVAAVPGVEGEVPAPTETVSDLTAYLGQLVTSARAETTARAAKRVAVDEAAALVYKKAVIDQNAAAEGENPTFDIEAAYKALEEESATALAQGKAGRMTATQAMALARKAHAPVVAAKKAADRTAGIRQLAIGDGLDPDAVAAYAKDFPNLAPGQIVTDFKAKQNTAQQIAALETELLNPLARDPQVAAGIRAQIARLNGQPAPGVTGAPTAGARVQPGAPAAPKAGAPRAAPDYGEADTTATPEMRALRARKTAAHQNLAMLHPDWSDAAIAEQVNAQFRDEELNLTFGQRFHANVGLASRARQLTVADPNLGIAAAIKQAIEAETGERVTAAMGREFVIAGPRRRGQPAGSTVEEQFPGAAVGLGALLTPGIGGAPQKVTSAQLQAALGGGGVELQNILAGITGDADSPFAGGFNTPEDVAKAVQMAAQAQANIARMQAADAATQRGRYKVDATGNLIPPEEERLKAEQERQRKAREAARTKAGPVLKI